MPDFVVLNELSLPLSDHNWQDQITTYKDAVSHLRDNGLGNVRVATHFKDLPHFTETKSLRAFLGGITDRDWNTKIKSLFVNHANFYQSPLIMETEPLELEELTINSEYYYKEESHCGGLACADIWNTLAISFSTAPHWTDNHITLSKAFVEDNKETIEINVPNLCSFDQAVVHAEFIQTLSSTSTPSSVEEMLQFSDSQTESYPFKLVYETAALSDLTKIYSSFDTAFIYKLYEVVKSVKSNPDEGIGKPERLKHIPGSSSRRLVGKHRFVYKIVDENVVSISACLGHYE